MMLTILIAIGTLSTALSTAAFPIEYIQRSIPENVTVRMGQGFNSLGGVMLSQGLSYCVDRSPLATLGGTQSERLSIFVDSIASSEEFTSTVRSSKNFGAAFSPATASDPSNAHKLNVLSAGILASDKDSMFRKYESKYNYVFVQIRKEFESEVLSSFDVHQNTLEYFSSRPDEFIAKCGDRFVSGVKKGAEVIGLLRCEAQSSEEKSSVDRIVKSNAGFKRFTAEGEVSELLEEVRRATRDNCRMMVMAQGGRGRYDLRDSAAFIASSIDYVRSSSPTEARPLEFITAPYRALLT